MLKLKIIVLCCYKTSALHVSTYYSVSTFDVLFQHAS